MPARLRPASKNFDHFSSRGFSLIEIVLAIGIMSFALVGILGLFPLALDSAKESAAETRISFIAQSLLSDIRTTEKITPPTPPATTTTRTAQLFTGKSPADLSSSTAYQPLNLHVSDVVYLAFDAAGECLGGTLTSSDFETGKPGAVFIAKISSSFSPPGHPGNTHIEVRVDYPAAAARSNRNFHSFTTLL